MPFLCRLIFAIGLAATEQTIQKEIAVFSITILKSKKAKMHSSCNLFKDIRIYLRIIIINVGYAGSVIDIAKENGISKLLLH